MGGGFPNGSAGNCWKGFAAHIMLSTYIDNMITYMLEGSGFGSWIPGPKKPESKS